MADSTQRIPTVLDRAIQTPVTQAHCRTIDVSKKKHIRGSLLLMLGRLFSMGVNFAVQVLTVRYLAKSEYGAFAFALSLVSMGGSLAIFGLDKTLSRFVPIYHEQRDYPKMFGSMVLMLTTILGIGLSMVLLTFGLSGFIAGSLVTDPLAVGLLLMLVFLVPVQAMDTLLAGMLAVFAKPRAIFWRRHVLGPCIKLAAVLLVMWSQSGVHFMAIGYLVGGLLGVALYMWLLFQVLLQQGLLREFHMRSLTLPAREVFAFNIPLLSSEIVFLLKGSLVVFLLQYFTGSIAVAEFRAVLPVARLNQVVMESFRFLYTPWAARLFARDDRSGINDLYWLTVVWILVLSLPVFVASFALAGPLTVLLFGEQYADSGAVMAILSLGYYFNAALGFNALTLKVFGKVRQIVLNDLAAGAVALVLSLILVPRFGALGGAIVTGGTLIVHNILNQITLMQIPGIKTFPIRYLKLCGLIMLCAVGLLVVQISVSPPIYVGMAIAGLGSLLILRLSRGVLEVEAMFPDLLRAPLMRRIWGIQGEPA
jgi:O-antigen/teichoic acid export membrane protein